MALMMSFVTPGLTRSIILYQSIGSPARLLQSHRHVVCCNGWMMPTWKDLRWSLMTFLSCALISDVHPFRFARTDAQSRGAHFLVLGSLKQNHHLLRQYATADALRCTDAFTIVAGTIAMTTQLAPTFRLERDYRIVPLPSDDYLEDESVSVDAAVTDSFSCHLLRRCRP